MSKSGKARVLTPDQFSRLLSAISQRRWPEKNTAIIQVSFKLGLRVQEIALLQIKEVAELEFHGNRTTGFRIKEVMPLPASYTKGARASSRTVTPYHRRRISMTIEEFDRKLRQVEEMARVGAEIDYKDFHPPLRTRKGRSRDIPMRDDALRDALARHLTVRMDMDPTLKPSDPLFVSQKGGPYSPNTLQDHMALMIRRWAGVEKGSSHSGRRTLLTGIIHGEEKGVGLKAAQQVAGHVNEATTLIYQELPEWSIADALTRVGKIYQ